MEIPYFLVSEVFNNLTDKDLRLTLLCTSNIANDFGKELIPNDDIERNIIECCRKRTKPLTYEAFKKMLTRDHRFDTYYTYYSESSKISELNKIQIPSEYFNEETIMLFFKSKVNGLDSGLNSYFSECINTFLKKNPEFKKKLYLSKAFNDDLKTYKSTLQFVTGENIPRKVQEFMLNYPGDMDQICSEITLDIDIQQQMLVKTFQEKLKIYERYSSFRWVIEMFKLVKNSILKKSAITYILRYSDYIDKEFIKKLVKRGDLDLFLASDILDENLGDNFLENL